MDTCLDAMTRAEYERHLYGQLCWHCHSPTGESHRLQRYCTECGSKWSYRHRLIEWELVKAFALGAPAYQAARTLRCSYANAHEVYRHCREVVLRHREKQRNLELERAGLKFAANTANRVLAEHLYDSSMILGVIEIANEVYSFAWRNTTERNILAWMRRSNLTGCCIDMMSFRTMKDLATMRPDSKSGPERLRHIDRVESFCLYCIRQWQHAHGILAKHVPFYLAESEFRFSQASGSLLDLLFDEWIVRIGRLSRK